MTYDEYHLKMWERQLRAIRIRMAIRRAMHSVGHWAYLLTIGEYGGTL